MNRELAIIFVVAAAVIMLFVTGCSGVGLEKHATLMPDSLSVGYMQEQYRRDTHAWDGISVSATWEFK